MDRVLLDIYADRNGTLQQEVSWIGVDLTSVTIDMDVRSLKDGGGAPLFRLTNVVSYSQGILTVYNATATVAAHIAAGRLTSDIYKIINPATGVDYVAGDSVQMATIWIIVNYTTLQGLAYPQERGDDLELYYDVYFSGTSLRPSPYLAGKFIVRAGVTLP